MPLCNGSDCPGRCRERRRKFELFGKHAINSPCGYTLLETVISLAVLCAVVVPLFAIFRHGGVVADTRRRLTGIWLVEQEAAVIGAFPGRALPVKRHRVENREWIVRTGISETQPPRYHITAELGGVTRAEARFYGRASNDRN